MCGNALAAAEDQIMTTQGPKALLARIAAQKPLGDCLVAFFAPG
jgi:hypothetical protein